MPGTADRHPDRDRLALDPFEAKPHDARREYSPSEGSAARHTQLFFNPLLLEIKERDPRGGTPGTFAGLAACSLRRVGPWVSGCLAAKG
jgi:hypothetical protein